MILLNKFSKILIVKLNMLGDTVCFLPTILAIRKGFPNAHLTLLTTNVGKEIIECGELVDTIWVAELNDIKTIPGFFRWLRSVKERKFDVAVASSDSSSFLSLLFFLSSIPIRAGFSNPKLSFLYNRKVPFTKDFTHTELNLMIARRLGLEIESIKPPMDLLISETENVKAVALLRRNGIKKNDRFIVFHVGSNKPSRRWPIERFAEVVNGLTRRQHELQFVCIGGNQENELVSRLWSIVKEDHIINLCGKTSTKQLIHIVSLSDLFVGHSSGPLHVAYMLGIPTVSLWGASSLPIWGPTWEKEKHVCIKSDIECLGCEQEICPKGTLECMERISADEVIKAILQLLERNSGKNLFSLKQNECII